MPTPTKTSGRRMGRYPGLILFSFCLVLATGCAKEKEQAPSVTYYACRAGSPGPYSLGSSETCAQSFDVMNSSVTSGGALAQSFVPHCEKIETVQLASYPTIGTRGWIRVDLTEDDNGKPGRLLARSWVRVDRGCDVPVYGYMPYPLGTVKVQQGKTYWMTFDEFVDADLLSAHSTWVLTNLGFRAESSDFTEGRLLFGDHQGWDANFRVPVAFDVERSCLQKASPSDMATLPSASIQEAPWQEAQKLYIAAVNPPTHELVPPVTSQPPAQGECVPRNQFPDNVAERVSALPGYSGLWWAVGPSADQCGAAMGCVLFTKPEMDMLWRQASWIYSQDSYIAVAPCRIPGEN
jgi:hypothetical protein